jgi:hypothetical protein
VDFSGAIVSMSGACPNVTLTVRGMTIVTDRSTTFTRSKCDDMRRGRSVSGTGTTQPNGTIKATEMRVSQNDDDNNNQ